MGQTHFADGVWVGLELDTSDGRNDGQVQGQRYFTCAPSHGVFVRWVLQFLLFAIPSATWGFISVILDIMLCLLKHTGEMEVSFRSTQFIELPGLL